MAEKDEKTAQAGADTKALATLPPAGVPAGLELYLDANRMNQLYKVADMYAKSDIIPKQFQQKSGNCFIALEMAGNMGISPIFLMQNMAVVHGKPTLEAKLVSAMVNASGRFVDPLDYEVKGDDPSYDKTKKAPKDPTYRVRAYAVRRKDNKTLYGPWITWDMALGEGWVQKEGSKWQTMPELMFMYRAASYFAKTHCTDITYGMQTTEEMMDVIDITPQPPATRAERTKARAGKILSGFEEEGEAGAGEVAGEAGTGEQHRESVEFPVNEEDCDHPLDGIEDTAEGEGICTACGREFQLEEGAPTFAEQKAIRAQEIAEQGKLFK